jgi:hypothetical protein
MPESYHASKPTLSFAKLVATPTDLAWSQSYNAGNLFACLELTKEEQDEEVSLQAIGKDIFNLLQSEFFSLEDKTPDTIKEAIKVSIAKVPDSVHISLTLANFKDNALTVLILGEGKVVMKRGDKVGVLLEKNDNQDEQSIYASGFLENTDTIVLQTGQFAQGISHETVLEALALELPNDVVESLSPQVHEQDNGAQSAIVVRFNGPAQHRPALIDPISEEEQIEEEVQPVISSETSPEEELQMHHEAPGGTAHENTDEDEEKEGKKSFSFKKLSLPLFSHASFDLTHKRKLYLSIAIILFILLGASVFFTIKKQADEQRLALFNQIYPSALRDYETAQGIESLNPEGSRDNYLSAQTKLQQGEEKIARGTEEYKQVEALLAKVNAELQGSKQEESSNTLKEAAPEKTSLIALAKENAEAQGFGQDTNTVYIISAENITAITKSSGNEKKVVENEDAWSTPQAVVPYQTNLYVLDQKAGVIKYSSTADGYDKSSYFTESAPNLSQATGMAIDSSIWIIGKDGKILKYTRGKQETFSISGLKKSLLGPTKIVTDSSMDSIYILDNGNKRIIKLDKKGAFQKEYPAGAAGTANEFEVDQKNNRILILSAGKIWELPL